MMLLSTLLQNIASVPVRVDRTISGLTLDSRQVVPGGLFVALKGTQLDGRQYIPDAIARGASAVLVDAVTEIDDLTAAVPLIYVHNLGARVGGLAARFYGEPAQQLRMIGVTGTNGKTSCTHFIAQILTALDMPCGIIGTLGSGFPPLQVQSGGLTTPDAITLQATLRTLLQQGAQAVAMEVSSHSIAQERINGVPFTIGIFTNLTQDHLDYHGDMTTYAAVKYRFLAEFGLQHIIVNADDPYGNKWLKTLCDKALTYAYSLKKINVPAAVQLIYADQYHFSLQGIHARVHTPWGDGALHVPLIGAFNLSNVLAVLTALCVYGLPLPAVLAQLANIAAVPARMQTVGGHGKPLVVIDYAHTPDALEKVLQALRVHTTGKLICVFGCGGNRDQGKRPLMAKIAEQYADKIIVTNDNPRHEEPKAIAAQIMQGFVAKADTVSVELDRSQAIKNSIQWATADDCVLIAGKGAEQYQQIGDEKVPFVDVEEVKKYLGELN